MTTAVTMSPEGSVQVMTQLLEPTEMLVVTVSCAG
jgi:hypothetical protein